MQTFKGFFVRLSSNLPFQRPNPDKNLAIAMTLCTVREMTDPDSQGPPSSRALTAETTRVSSSMHDLLAILCVSASEATLAQLASATAKTYSRKTQSEDSVGRIALVCAVCTCAEQSALLMPVLDTLLGCTDTIIEDIAALEASQRKAVAQRIVTHQSHAPLLETLARKCFYAVNVSSGECSSNVVNSNFLSLLNDCVASLCSLVPTDNMTPRSMETIEHASLTAFAILNEFLSHPRSEGDSEGGSEEHGGNLKTHLLKALVTARPFSKMQNLHKTLLELFKIISSTSALWKGSGMADEDNIRTANAAREFIDFVFSNIVSRSYSRLLSLCLLYAEYDEASLLESLKARTAASLNDLDADATLFGLATAFAIEKYNLTTSASSSTKEFYYTWLACMISASGRKAHQFLANLIQDTFAESPLDFNVSTLQAIKNHANILAPFKSIYQELKSHVVEQQRSHGTGGSLSEARLVEIGVLTMNDTKQNISLDKVIADFKGGGGGTAVPRYLFMEILVNDGWYKGYLLPRLLEGMQSEDQDESKTMKALFEGLRKAGKVPAYFLASASGNGSLGALGKVASHMGKMLKSNVPYVPPQLSLQNLEDIKSRLEASLTVLLELNSDADEGFERDCVSAVQTTFTTLQNLFKKEGCTTAGVRFSVDAFGILECSGVLCNRASIAIVDCFLDVIAVKFDVMDMDNDWNGDPRMSQAFELLLKYLRACFPVLVLRIFSLVHGPSTLSPSQCLLIARLLYHLCLTIPSGFLSTDRALTDVAADEAEIDAKNEMPDNSSTVVCLGLFFERFKTVACAEHVGMIASIFIGLLESRRLSSQISERESQFFLHSGPLLDSLRDAVHVVQARHELFSASSRFVDLLPLPLSLKFGAVKWAVWESSFDCGGMNLRRRTSYIKAMIRRYIQLSRDKDSSCENLAAELLRAIVDFQAYRVMHQPVSDDEGVSCVLAGLNELLSEISASSSIERIYGFLSVRTFEVFFSLADSFLTPGVLWIGYEGHDGQGLAAIEKGAQFWERILLSEGGPLAPIVDLEWDTLSHAVTRLFDAIFMMVPTQERTLALITVLFSNCPLLCSIYFASRNIPGLSTHLTPLSALTGKDVLDALRQPSVAHFWSFVKSFLITCTLAGFNSP
ncbi:hypothetical protein BC830DRAFT_288958 [Chytriomyces sp. MP71]|nr:hypothetical protein BC830DRAFT_288958 [Chytriomyces sp. MP71]